MWRRFGSPLEQLRFLDVSHSWIHGAILEQNMTAWSRAGLKEMWVTGAFWESDAMMLDVQAKGEETGIAVEL